MLIGYFYSQVKQLTMSTTKSTKSLVQLIKIAISKHDIAKLYELKDICDHIHQTGKGYKGYKPEDLPTDELYEEMVRTIESNGSDTMATIVADQTSAPDDVKHRHQKLISDMWMGSITKETEILTIDNALLLPKFDGCSCGVKLKRYTPNGKFELVETLTRGTEEGYTRNRSNITDRFTMIAEGLLNALNSSEAQSFTLNNKPFGSVLQLTLRGEIVLKDRTSTNTAPASVVAGKINGHMAVWTNALHLIEFIPYEIMRCNYDLTNYYDYYVPTQEETINLFRSVKLITFPVITADLNADSLPMVQEHFTHLNDSIPQPMDGVVYCSSTWRYPVYTEQTKPKQYGKYAWKPSSEATSTLKQIAYSLARDGKFTFILTYDAVKINGKNYRNAKTATSRMISLDGIGIGSVITVKLAGDISPMITDFINESEDVKPFKFPSKCPFCNTKTVLKKTGKTPTFSCPNPACPEVLKQKMLNFLSTLHIKGVAEGKLSKLDEITLSAVVSEYLGKQFMKKTLNETDTRSFLVALGIGGAQAVSRRLREQSHMNPLATVKTNFDDICSFLTDEIAIDPFIESCLDYIGDILFEDE